jgi:hypothetical protein
VRGAVYAADADAAYAAADAAKAASYGKAYAAAYAADAAANANADATLWEQIRSDCERLLNGKKLNRRAVFSTSRPVWFRQKWREVKNQLSSEWAFWSDWYESTLSGKVQNWDMI